MSILFITSFVKSDTDHDHDHGHVNEEEAAYFKSDAENVPVFINIKAGTVTIPLEYYSYLVANCGGVPYMDCTIKPVFNGYDPITSNNSVLYANFGYKSYCPGNVTLPVGDYNHFHPLPAYRGQPTTFSPGEHNSILKLPVDSGITLAWDLKGPDRKLNHVCAGARFVFS